MERMGWTVDDVRKLPISGYFTIAEYYEDKTRTRKVPPDIAEKQAKELERVWALKKEWLSRKELTNLAG